MQRKELQVLVFRGEALQPWPQPTPSAAGPSVWPQASASLGSEVLGPSDLVPPPLSPSLSARGGLPGSQAWLQVETSGRLENAE